MAEQDPPPANQVYYLDVGLGDWEGRFTFRLTDWAAFRRNRAGAVDRFLSLWLIAIFKLTGWGSITSSLRRVDDGGSSGGGDSPPERTAGQSPPVRVGNHVRIHRFGISLYVLTETYTLDADGSDVVVDALERFGPVPFLFRHRKRHTARVLDAGLRAVYTYPLLGSEWRAVYMVHPDRRHVDSTMTCAWAEAHERIAKRTL